VQNALRSLGELCSVRTVEESIREGRATECVTPPGGELGVGPSATRPTSSHQLHYDSTNVALAMEHQVLVMVADILHDSSQHRVAARPVLVLACDAPGVDDAMDAAQQHNVTCMYIGNSQYLQKYANCYITWDEMLQP
jgi:hypothetical protein